MKRASIVSQARTRIRYLIWAYLILLLFEGALRKWVAPSLSAPLLLVRDPIVLWAYVEALRAGVFPKDAFTISLGVLAGIFGVFGLAALLAEPGGSIAVWTYGLRANFLHLPLLFLMPAALGRNDLLTMGRFLVILALPVGILMAFQFQSPPGHVLNATVGGTGSLLPSAMGRIRPSAIFSFSTGVTQFLPLVAAFAWYGLLGNRRIGWTASIVAGSGLVLALAVSGSRAAVGAVFLVLCGGVLFLLMRPEYAGRGVRTVAVVGLLGVGLSATPFFSQGFDVLEARIEGASGLADDSSYRLEPRDEGTPGVVTQFYNGVVLRYVRQLQAPIHKAREAPFLGAGLGVGTNAGAAMLGARGEFLLAEGEWPRLVMESGPLLGFAFIAWRIVLVLWMGFLVLRKARKHDPLPLLILSACALLLLDGQFAQPTTSGFAVIGGGLVLTAVFSSRNPRDRR